MAVWHRTRRGDLGLRALGSGLSALAYVALARLFAAHGPLPAAGLHVYLLAAIGFLCASAGGALVLVGANLFDEIEVSARWQPRTGPFPLDDLPPLARW